MNELEVKRNYSFWRHPIKWWLDRKVIALMNILTNAQWKNGMRKEVEKIKMDMFLYGTVVMKNGKRVDPEKLAKLFSK